MEKTKRHRIYKRALAEHKKLTDSQYRVLCPLIGTTYNDGRFPEFYFFEPKHCIDSYRAWFSKSGFASDEYLDKKTKEHQRTILEFCIEMTR